MKCPRCQVELDEGHCPKCNWSIQPARGAKEEADAESPAQEARSDTIGFPIEFVTAQTPPAISDWRSELKKKLEQHYRKQGDTPEELDVAPVRKEKKIRPKSAGRRADVAGQTSDKGSSDPAAKVVQSEDATKSPSGGEVVRQLFRYKLGDVTPSPEKRIVTFARESKAPEKPVKKLLEKPVIRPPLKARTSSPPSGPQQGSLSLEKISKSIEQSNVPGEQAAKTEPFHLSREVLLSRVLALIVDLVVAVCCGSLFAFIGATVVGAEFPSPQTVQVALACAVVFFFLNGILFQVTAGQTPGMMWTDLTLVSEEDGGVSLKSVLVRTVLLPISILTVLGLLWAFADSRCRCLHDRLSGTYIVPGYFAAGSHKPNLPV